MKYGLIIGLASMLFGLPAIADDNKWVYVGAGSNSQAYLQNSEVDSDVNSGNVETWTKSVFPDGSHDLDKHRYACSKDELLRLEVYKYDINGNYLSGGKIKPVWFSAIPESVGYLMMKTVCMAAAKQELDKIELAEGGYTSEEAYTLIRKSFGKYADAVVMDNVQQSMDNMEW